MILKRITEMSATKLSTMVLFINLPKADNLIDLLNKVMNMKVEKYTDYYVDITPMIDFTRTNIEKDIDNMVFDAYDIYYNIKDILTDAHREYSEIEGLTLMWDFLKSYEEILTTSKFIKPKTKTIQKMFFENLMKKEIKKENYEYCSEIQTLLKTF